jgi:site-specific DNA recombinase
VCDTLDKKGSGSCPAKHLNTHKFKSLVIKQVKERILTRESLIDLIREINDEIDGLGHTIISK